MMFLETTGLCQRRDNGLTLKDVNLGVEQGEVFVIIGPTGAGKTTLLRLLGLLDRPVAGSIILDGREVTDSEKLRLEVRRRMAMVFQKPVVFNASVYSNVAYGLKIRGVNRATQRSKVAAALETVGLSGYERRNARTLSGGEIQRVALARAMVIEPELLLLDEPTANLDPVSTATVEKMVSRVIQKLHTTVIMTTHDMFQGQRLADRMGVLMGGEMLQTGDPREVFNLPSGKEIAEFVGMENLLSGVIVSNEGGVVAVDVNGFPIEALSNLDPGEPVYVGIRPEEITLTGRTDATSARNVFPGEVVRTVAFGPLVNVELDCGIPLKALITKRSADEMNIVRGTHIGASFKATAIHVIPRQLPETRIQ
jgi:tungstate transport system ATP-binding protein